MGDLRYANEARKHHALADPLPGVTRETNGSIPSNATSNMREESWQ